MTIEAELNDKVMKISQQQSSHLLSIHGEGTCIIRAVGKVYILDLVKTQNEIQHIIFGIDDDYIKDEMNRSFVSLDAFLKSVGASSILTPSKDT